MRLFKENRGSVLSMTKFKEDLNRLWRRDDASESTASISSEDNAIRCECSPLVGCCWVIVIFCVLYAAAFFVYVFLMIPYQADPSKATTDWNCVFSAWKHDLFFSFQIGLPFIYLFCAFILTAALLTRKTLRLLAFCVVWLLTVLLDLSLRLGFFAYQCDLVPALVYCCVAIIIAVYELTLLLRVCCYFMLLRSERRGRREEIFRRAMAAARESLIPRSGKLVPTCHGVKREALPVLRPKEEWNVIHIPLHQEEVNVVETMAEYKARKASEGEKGTEKAPGSKPEEKPEPKPEPKPEA